MRILLVLVPAMLLLLTGCADNTYPFTEVTDEFTFTYSLPEEGVVDVIVLNCYMNNVRTLISSESQTSGEHTSSWNLQNKDGERVPDGLYYIRIILDDEVIETQMYEVHK